MKGHGTSMKIWRSFLLSKFDIRAWPRYCRKEYWTKMDQNGPNDHFGQNGLIPNWILAFARPKWTKMVHFGPFWPEEVHFGPFRSANRTLVTPEISCLSASKLRGRSIGKGSLQRNSASFPRNFRTLSIKQGSTPTPWARGLRDQIQKWALQTQKTLYF